MNVSMASRLPWALVGLLTGLLLASTSAFSDDPTNTYTGCLAKNGGLDGVAIGDTPVKPCKGKATQISWGEQGPQGAPGPAGQDGADGRPGISGYEIVNGPECPGTKRALGAGIDWVITLDEPGQTSPEYQFVLDDAPLPNGAGWIGHSRPFLDGTGSVLSRPGAGVVCAFVEE